LLTAESRWLFVITASYLVLVSGMPGANARYRLPVMPLVCIAAGAALDAARARRIEAIAGRRVAVRESRGES